MSGGAYVPEEALTVEQAFKLFGAWPAYGAYEEHDKGSITVGKLGDFAVLSDNPFTVEPDALFDLNVEATIAGSRVVFEG